MARPAHQQNHMRCESRAIFGSRTTQMDGAQEQNSISDMSKCQVFSGNYNIKGIAKIDRGDEMGWNLVNLICATTLQGLLLYKRVLSSPYLIFSRRGGELEKLIPQGKFENWTKGFLWFFPFLFSYRDKALREDIGETLEKEALCSQCVNQSIFKLVKKLP